MTSIKKARKIKARKIGNKEKITLLTLDFFFKKKNGLGREK